MALIERCPNAWHRLIERLILKKRIKCNMIKNIQLIKLIIKSGEQVSKKKVITTYLKVRTKSLIIKKGFNIYNQ